MPIDELFVEINGEVDKSAKAIETFAKNLENTYKKLGSASEEVTQKTTALEKRITSTARELNVLDKVVLKINAVFNKTGQVISYTTDVAQTFTTAVAKLSSLFATFGVVGSRVFKAININKYKQFRNYIIGLGVSTAKTTGIVNKLGMGILRLMPLWARWALGIGGALIAIKTINWAVNKFRDSLLDLNKDLAESTKPLVFIHKGAIVSLDKEYARLRYDLSAVQAGILSDYDSAANYLKQQSEALAAWWDIHSPFKRMWRSVVINSANIISAIKDLFFEY